MHQSSFRSQGSSSRQSSSSMVGSEASADTDVTEAERDKIINSLLSYGAVMMRKGVFSLPKLAWNHDEAGKTPLMHQTKIPFMHQDNFRIFSCSKSTIRAPNLGEGQMF